jgi:hypothetical protein
LYDYKVKIIFSFPQSSKLKAQSSKLKAQSSKLKAFLIQIVFIKIVRINTKSKKFNFYRLIKNFEARGPTLIYWAVGWEFEIEALSDIRK